MGQSTKPPDRTATVLRRRPTSAVAVTAIRNLEDEAWLERLEIEVKNISTKPVYYLVIVVSFPDLVTTALDGVPRTQVMPLHYGRRDLMRDGYFATADDIPIKPGESYVFRIPEPYRKGLEDRLAAGIAPQSAVKRLVVSVENLSFGDGTGFRFSGAVPFG